MKTPELSTVNDILNSSNRYKAPVFQRFYVWGQTELNAIFDDLDAVAVDANGEASATRFLGAAVLQDIGKVAGAASPNEYLIVDGQQRLTTIYLLITSIAYHYMKNGDINAGNQVVSKYLIESGGPPHKGLPKVVPTLQDRDQLWSIFEEQLGDLNVEWNFRLDPRESSSKKKLADQWARIQQRFDDMFYDAEGHFLADELNLFLEKVVSGLQFVNIILDKSDDANLIFSKLNYQGIDLLLSDLVRNDVFGRFSKGDPKKAEDFYKKKWLPFEKLFPNKSLDQFFPIIAVIKFEGKVTLSSAFPKMQQSWLDSNMKAQDILNEFREYEEYFLALVKYRDISGLNSSLSEIVHSISLMPKTTVTWPYIIQLLRAAANKQVASNDALACLKLVEAFLARRAMIGNEPTGLHAVFKGLWKTAGADLEKAKSRIVTKTIKCPTDAELCAHLADNAVDTSKFIEFFFREYEKSVRQTDSADPPSNIDFTKEHILPGGSNIPRDWAHFSPDMHKRCKGLIGNLTPLSGRQNKASQNEEWPRKRSRYQGSNWHVTSKLGQRQIEQWTEDSIRERTQELVNWALCRWPNLVG